MITQNSKIFIAGHQGLVGSALTQRLEAHGYHDLILRTRQQCDLLDIDAVKKLFADTKPDVVFLAAAKVGGIWANQSLPADFIFQNLQIQNNVISQALAHDIQELYFLGSSCIYPKHCHQPMRESDLLTSSLESSNRPYAIAKIAGLELCWAFNRQYGTQYLGFMPTNLYGPGDNYHPYHSHVIPGLIRKIVHAKLNNLPVVTLWGTGTPKREFLYSLDLADACIHIMEDQNFKEKLCQQTETPPIVNVGSNHEVTIKTLAELIATTVGFTGKFNFDLSKPDGTPRKLLGSTLLNSTGWTAQTSLAQGLSIVCKEYQNTINSPDTVLS